MKFSEYETELRLAYSQHPKDSREEEIYSLILALLREVYSSKIYKDKVYSFRDVHQPTYHMRENLHGSVSYPDIVVYSQELKDDSNPDESVHILGAVEAKAIGVSYHTYHTEKQLHEEIKYFSKVLYTNGIVWIYYDTTKKPVKSLESLDEDYIWRVNLFQEEDKNIHAEFSKEGTGPEPKEIPELSYAKWRKLKKLLRNDTNWEKEV